MYKLVTRQAREVTPSQAKEFLVLNTFEGQRKLELWKANYYYDEKFAGRMRPIDIAIARLLYDKLKRVMVNGQHTATMIVMANCPHPANVEYYDCETPEDLWKLYASFDVHASRTEYQIIKAARGLFDDSRLHSIPLRELQCCSTALLMLGNGTSLQFKNAKVPKIKKPELLTEHPDEVRFVHCYTDTKFMIRVGVVTAMIATYRANRKKAMEFWDAVATGEMLMKQDPRKRLRDTLIRKIALKSSDTGLRKKTEYSTCISWWNSFITGKPRASVKIHAMKAPPKVLSQ